MNTKERDPVLGFAKRRMVVESSWFRGEADVTTLAPEEIVATKVRALLQREKGRDLYDLWLGLDHMGLDGGKIAEVFAAGLVESRRATARSVPSAILAPSSHAGRASPLSQTAATRAASTWSGRCGARSRSGVGSLVPMQGRTLGPYRLDRELGAGGMGKVWSAHVEGRGAGLDAGTVVALKVVHPHLLETPGFFHRFLREAEIGRSVRHENVVQTYGCDQIVADGKLLSFLVMEYVEGQTLRQLLDDLERVPRNSAVTSAARSRRASRRSTRRGSSTAT